MVSCKRWRFWDDHPMKTFLVALLCAVSLAAEANDITSEAGRAILKEHQDSVLPFTATVTVSGTGNGRSMPGRDRPVRGIATVISKDGLMVTSLNTVDPSALLATMDQARRSDLKFSTQIKELKIVMPDGLEIPAGIVMKDADLDLAFFRPKPGNDDLKDVTFHPADLTQAGVADILDEVLTISRLGKTFGFDPTSFTTEVTAKVEKPRLSYHVPGVTPGTPVYTQENKILGIAAIRAPQSDPAAGMTNELLVIVPAAEVNRIAEQAAKAPLPPEDAENEKPAEEKPAESKPEPKEPAPQAPGAEPKPADAAPQK